MIGRLTGLVIDHGNDGACVLDVGGVGYEVFVPLRTLARLPLSSPVTLHVHTHVREDALVLYGFSLTDDRAAFRVLLGVSGVGPKLAMAVLSELSADELSRAIAGGNRQRLEAISGVGRKTAARLLLELKDKLALRPGALAVPEVPTTAITTSDVGARLCDTLVGLGFTRAQAEGALAKLGAVEPSSSLEQLLRRALVVMG